MTQQDAAHRAAEQRLKAQSGFWRTFGVFAIVWIVCTVIWALSGGGAFWPIWVILGTGVALLFMAWGAFGPREKAPSQEQIDAEARKFGE